MNILISAKSFFLKCKRVWFILRKPTNKEFWQVSKVSAMGIVALGILGFAISMLMKIFVK